MFEIENIMTKNVITIEANAPIREAINIMIEKDITGLPVVDDKMTLVGIVSEKDVLRLLCNIGDRPGKVEEFMTKNVVFFDQNDSLANVCDCLLANHFRSVPIVAGPKKKLAGIISRKDIVKNIFHYQSFYRDTPHLPHQLADAKKNMQNCPIPIK